MLLSGQAHVVAPGEGRVVDLGVTRMRVLAAGGTTGRTFTLVEFAGNEGPWTVPHLHRAMEESFFVLEGGFTFGVGNAEIEAGPGHTCWFPVKHGTLSPPTRAVAGASCSW